MYQIATVPLCSNGSLDKDNTGVNTVLNTELNPFYQVTQCIPMKLSLMTYVESFVLLLNIFTRRSLCQATQLPPTIDSA